MMATRIKEADKKVAELIETLIEQSELMTKQMAALQKRVREVAKHCGYAMPVDD
jgi:methyl-accepting chemotaxis protein